LILLNILSWYMYCIALHYVKVDATNFNKKGTFNMKILNILAVALASLIVVVPASANTVTYDFANLTSNGINNAGFLPDEILQSGYWQCGDDICSSKLTDPINPLGGDLKYTAGGITTTATGHYFNQGIWNQATVMQDSENHYNALNHIGAGLGVYHLTNDESDDNITANEKLILKFATAVRLSALSLRSDGHITTWIPGATFLFNGVNTVLAGDITGLDVVGTEFTFAFGGNHPDQFYLGGLTVSDVPEPSIYALLLAGFGAMCLIGNRRKQRL
jgi:hypothetical protein